MKIDLNPALGSAASSLEQSRLGKTASTRSEAAHPRAASQSSASAKDSSLNSLSAAALAAPEVRQQKVEALTAQLAGRTYQVSSSQIAASLLDALRVNG